MKPSKLINGLKSIQTDLTDLIAAIESGERKPNAMDKLAPETRKLKAIKQVILAAKAADAADKARESVFKQMPVHSSTRKKTTGLAGLKNGTRLYTTITMGTRAIGETRRVGAVIRDGLIFVEGRARGISNLTVARRAAESVAGRNAASMKLAAGTQSWRLETTGQSVEQYRKAPGPVRVVQGELALGK